VCHQARATERVRPFSVARAWRPTVGLPLSSNVRHRNPLRPLSHLAKKVTHRTLELTTFEDYSACCLTDSLAANEVSLKRQAHLAQFPHQVMLLLSYAEVDFVERWCWQHLGPMDGECMQYQSEYRVCQEGANHSHSGKWLRYWHEKIDYNYGYCEYYFSELHDKDAFTMEIPKFNWGENYPK
jgi:hypothetical protein